MVLLRKFKSEDAPLIATYMAEQELHRYLSDNVPFPYSMSHADRFVETAAANFPLDCAIVFDGIFVGAINLGEKGGVYRVNMELGYWLGKPHWGKGIAREAIRQISRVAFRQPEIERVFANVFAENIPSYRTLERCGYQREALHSRSLIKGGIVSDCVVYAALKEQWGEWDRITPHFGL